MYGYYWDTWLNSIQSNSCMTALTHVYMYRISLTLSLYIYLSTYIYIFIYVYTNTSFNTDTCTERKQRKNRQHKLYSCAVLLNRPLEPHFIQAWLLSHKHVHLFNSWYNNKWRSLIVGYARMAWHIITYKRYWITQKILDDLSDRDQAFTSLVGRDHDTAAKGAWDEAWKPGPFATSFSIVQRMSASEYSSLMDVAKENSTDKYASSSCWNADLLVQITSSCWNPDLQITVMNYELWVVLWVVKSLSGWYLHNKSSWLNYEIVMNSIIEPPRRTSSPRSSIWSHPFSPTCGSRPHAPHPSRSPHWARWSPRLSTPPVAWRWGPPCESSPPLSRSLEGQWRLKHSGALPHSEFLLTD